MPLASIAVGYTALLLGGALLRRRHPLEEERASFDVDQLPPVAPKAIEKTDCTERILNGFTLTPWHFDLEQFLRTAT